VRNPPLSDQYGEALAMLARGHPTDAAEVLEPLVSQHEASFCCIPRSVRRKWRPAR